MEAFIRELGASYGFDRIIAVDKGDFVDLQVMVLPVALRGKGVGSRFMAEVCTAADRLGVVIGTCPEPLEPGWTARDRDRLVGWYERFGFRANPDRERYRVTYLRPPSVTSRGPGRVSPAAGGPGGPEP